MTVFLKRLALKVVGIFLATLAAQAAASTPFDVQTFAWVPALTVSASAAVLVLLEGLAGRFTGDPERPRISE
jgi:hypothetical protein